MTTEEFKVERSNHVGAEKGHEVKIQNLRPVYGAYQKITVETTTEVAAKLLEKRYVRVGMNNCRVLKGVKVITSRKCWEAGHVEVKCKGMDRRECCYRCGGKEHQARECSKKARCLSCGTDGHRTNTMAWPVFRSIIREEREAEAP